MQFIQGYNRNQTTFSTLDDQIEADNPVRLMDAFIDKLDLEKLGFGKTIRRSEGRPRWCKYAGGLQQRRALVLMGVGDKMAQVRHAHGLAAYLRQMGVFENRQPLTEAKLITKSSLFILLSGVIRRLELKPNSEQKAENIFVAPPYCQTACWLLGEFLRLNLFNERKV